MNHGGRRQGAMDREEASREILRQSTYDEAM
jgi:hypothetical protein